VEFLLNLSGFATGLIACNRIHLAKLIAALPPRLSPSQSITHFPVDHMKIKALILLTIAACTIVSTPAFAEKSGAPKVDEFGDSVEKGKPTIDISKYPIINAGDWRSAKPKIPWSTPVLVRDDFDGDYLAVFDRNYQGGGMMSEHETGIISNWSRGSLRIYAYDKVNICSLLCKSVESTRETQQVSIKAGKQVFRLTGKEGNYAITEEIAAALRDAPTGETKIKIKFEGSGVDVVSNIGDKTVAAWKVVYQDAKGPTAQPKVTAADVKPQPPGKTKGKK
jgi:hypothetical protein